MITVHVASLHALLPPPEWEDKLKYKFPGKIHIKSTFGNFEWEIRSYFQAFKAKYEATQDFLGGSEFKRLSLQKPTTDFTLKIQFFLSAGISKPYPSQSLK